ncbi:hypothetical protein [Cyanothece sp. BG0011]|uniref:hypothetical protein n=1 Tax=Cyanothece sp. BG0011 TaxID=2082950 RepID=UPI0013008CB0|nr:hypothetical protein [Cyanothece sp. BG0011]
MNFISSIFSLATSVIGLSKRIPYSSDDLAMNHFTDSGIAEGDVSDLDLLAVKLDLVNRLRELEPITDGEQFDAIVHQVITSRYSTI